MVPLDSPDYHLNQESSDFLAQLCQDLSDENDALTALVRSTLTRLRSLQGSQNARVATKDETATIGQTDGAVADPPTQPSPEIPATHEELTAELNGTLEQLYQILTNPSFVPLEEVEIREAEIARLRQGWLRMEARWKDAVSIMDGWRRRIADDGTLLNVDEGALSPVNVPDDLERGHDGETVTADGDVGSPEEPPADCVVSADDDHVVDQMIASARTEGIATNHQENDGGILEQDANDLIFQERASNTSTTVKLIEKSQVFTTTTDVSQGLRDEGDQAGTSGPHSPITVPAPLSSLRSSPRPPDQSYLHQVIQFPSLGVSGRIRSREGGERGLKNTSTMTKLTLSRF